MVFLYRDESGEYSRVLADKSLYRREIETLARNMQYFLDLERVLINGKRVYPTVAGVEVGLAGARDLAFAQFHIVFRGEMVPGLNKYEDEYESEVAEYDYTVYWLFPEGWRVLRARLDVAHEVLEAGRVLRFFVPRGTRLSGREEIEFEIPERRAAQK